MASRFNLYLRGWLGLLDAKVGGVAPQAYEDAVRGTLDAYPFAYAQQRLFKDGSVVVGPADEGFWPVTGAQVPPGEIWLCEWFSLQANMLAADTLEFVPAVQVRGTSGIPQTVTLADSTPTGGANGQINCSVAIRPYIALPGDNFGVHVRQISTAGTISVQLNLMYVACPV